MLRNCIYHLCDDAVPLFHVRKRRFPIQLPGLSKNHESERNQLMKKSNRKKFLQFVVLVLFLAALFVPQDANRLLIAGIALIGIGVTLFSYLLPLFTERLKNREHKLRKRPERTRHLEGTSVWKPFSGDRSNSRLPESSRKPSRCHMGFCERTTALPDTGWGTITDSHTEYRKL